jgi:O-antigen biosynthesis protein
VRESGLNPLIHFMRYGKAEGRRASAGTAPAIESFSPSRASEVAEEAEPLLSILMPTYNTPPRYLCLAIESVLRQSYRGWQLCIHDDGSSAPETLEALKNYQGRDPRIQIQFGAKNEGIARATNRALSLAAGQFIAMLDHDDEIVPEALLEVAYVLNADPSIDALYTDQAYIDAEGGSLEPFYKPDWSPDMFRGVMFVGHLLVVRRSLTVELGGFDTNFDRAQDFEFMLRVAEKTNKIYHLPKILYYWRRIPGSVAFDGNQKGPIEPIQSAAVNAHLTRLGIPAVAEPHPALSHRLVIKPWPRKHLPKVKVVVREASSPDPNSRCIASILERSTYSNYTIVAAQPPPPEFGQDRRVEVSSAPRLNAGPEDFVIWIDSALEVLTPDWIEHFLLYCEQPQIACAAPLIVKEDGTVWHSGLVLGMNRTVDYPMQGLPSDSDGYAGSLSCAREVSCLSGECMMVSRPRLEGLGGLVRYYQHSMFEGADLSLRAYVTGLRNIVTPRVVLRKLADSKRAEGCELDRALFADRWGALVQFGDRFYNPNFSPASPGYQAKKMHAMTAK